MGKQYVNPYVNKGMDAIERFLFPYRSQSPRHVELTVVRSELEHISDKLYHIMVSVNEEPNRHISVFKEDVPYYLRKIKEGLEVMGHVVLLGENSLFQNAK